jgi:hypothetical protein
VLQRFNLHTTTSFASLDLHWKAQLMRIHDEYLESRQVRLSRPTLCSALVAAANATGE